METSTIPSSRADVAAPRPASREPHPDDLGNRPNVETTHHAARGVRVAQGLGWFSVGVGLTQLLAPHLIGRLIGVKSDRGLLIRLLGARELASGLALLSNRRAAWWTAARVGGDAIDLGLLGAAIANPVNDRARLGVAVSAMLGVAAIDAWTTRQLLGDPARQEQVARVTHVGKAITIDASARDLYAFWRDLGNLPKIMPHLRSVERLDAVRSQWIADGPRNTTVRWESEIVDDEPGQRIAWRTLDGPFESSGSVRFLPAPGGRGTEVVVDMHYQLTGGLAGKLVALVTARAPGLEVARGLHRLKQRFELGEPMLARAPTPTPGAR